MTKVIKAEIITKEAFEPFGDLITFEGAQTFNCNQGRAVRYHDLAKSVDVTDEGGRAGLSIYRSVASPSPFKVEVMERHPLGSQIFIPMTMSPNTRFLIAVAPCGELDLNQVRAFIVPGQQGINYKKGIWHLPIVALDQALDFLTLDRIGDHKNCDEVFLEEPYLVAS
jgi:ureidoglycolate lyase